VPLWVGAAVVGVGWGRKGGRAQPAAYLHKCRTPPPPHHTFKPQHSATYGEMVRQQLARSTSTPSSSGAQHKARDKDQGVTTTAAAQQQQQPSEATAARWQAYAAALPDELQPGSAGRPVPMRCVGCGYGKQQRLLSLWLREQRLSKAAGAVPDPLPEVPFFSADCEVTVEPITQADEMVVLPSGGLTELVSPQETALITHAFGGHKLAALRDAYVGGGGGGVGAQAGGRGTGAAAANKDGGRLREGNVASAVTHIAMGKAVDRHNRVYRQRLDYDGLLVSHGGDGGNGGGLLGCAS